jgi:hypothetical protein
MRVINLTLRASLEVKNGSLDASLGEWKAAFDKAEHVLKSMLQSHGGLATSVHRELEEEVTGLVAPSHPWIKRVRINWEIEDGRPEAAVPDGGSQD